MTLEGQSQKQSPLQQQQIIILDEEEESSLENNQQSKQEFQDKKTQFLNTNSQQIKQVKTADGEFLYKGFMIEDECLGLGEALYQNRYYKGQFGGNQPNGFGDCVWEDGASYSGDWESGKK